MTKTQDRDDDRSDPTFGMLSLATFILGILLVIGGVVTKARDRAIEPTQVELVDAMLQWGIALALLGLISLGLTVYLRFRENRRSQ